MFIVKIIATENAAPEMVGPFPDAHWANRYIERMGNQYYSCEIDHLLSPILISVGSAHFVVFDPARNIDIQTSIDKEIANDRK